MLWPLSQNGCRWRVPWRARLVFGVIVLLNHGLTEGLMSHLCKWPVVIIHFPGLHFGFVESFIHISLQVLLYNVQQMSLNIEWAFGGRQMKRMYFEHSTSAVWAVPFGVQSFWIGFCVIFEWPFTSLKKKKKSWSSKLVQKASHSSSVPLLEFLFFFGKV